MKSFQLIIKLTLILFTIFIGSSIVTKLIYAETTLQLGSFTPLAVPPQEVNAECKDVYAENWIQRFKSNGKLESLETTSKQLVSCEIYRYLTGCRNNSNACTKPCIYIKDQITAGQIAKYPGVKENLADFHATSEKLFSPYYIYTKGVGRFDLRMGFGLTKAGKEEMDTTLSALSCVERLDQIHDHLDTPLYFYPNKNMLLELSLPNHSPVSINANSSGVITINNRQYGSISYEIAKSRINRPDDGFIILGNELESALETIGLQLQFTLLERHDFVDHWLHVLPKAAYYQVRLLDETMAQKLASWSVFPKPDKEIRYIFYFKPLIDRPSNLSDSFRLTPVSREKFTVVDIGGFIDW